MKCYKCGGTVSFGHIDEFPVMCMCHCWPKDKVARIEITPDMFADKWHGIQAKKEISDIPSWRRLKKWSLKRLFIRLFGSRVPDDRVYWFLNEWYWLEA